jgi:hypothetical protein
LFFCLALASLLFGDVGLVFNVKRLGDAMGGAASS